MHPALVFTIPKFAPSKANLVHSEGPRVYNVAHRGDQNENIGWNEIDKPRLRPVIETGPPKFRRQCRRRRRICRD